MAWKTAIDQLHEEAARAREMSPEARLQAAFSLHRFAIRLLLDSGGLSEKLDILGKVEEQGNSRVREWIRRNCAG